MACKGSGVRVPSAPLTTSQVTGLQPRSRRRETRWLPLAERAQSATAVTFVCRNGGRRRRPPIQTTCRRSVIVVAVTRSTAEPDVLDEVRSSVLNEGRGLGHAGVLACLQLPDSR